MQKTEFIIGQNGSVVRRRISEDEIQVSDEAILSMSAGFARGIKNAIEIPEWGLVHLNADQKSVFANLLLKKIPLRAPFRTVGDKIVPNFDSTSDPVMSLQWTPPPGCQLLLLMEIQNHSGTQVVSTVWLMACDTYKRTYRLPLPNVHDDCHMCLGDWQNHFATVYDAIMGVLEQFDKSSWNADLWKAREKTQKFFQFKPTNQGFEVLQPEFPHWSEGCEKVAINPQKYILL